MRKQIKITLNKKFNDILKFILIFIKTLIVYNTKLVKSYFNYNHILNKRMHYSITNLKTKDYIK